MATRARDQGGFGLIELLIAMTILNVALLAIVASFTAGSVTLARAARVSTAAALAASQLEGYRALAYDDITLQTSTVPTTAPYTTDPAYAGTRVEAAACPPAASANDCDATRTATGADGRSYRLDTFIVYVTEPSSGRQMKRVTAVVRDPANVTGRPLARHATTFDRSSG